MHLLAAATTAHAAHRAGIQVIQPHCQFQVAFRDGQFVGYVETVPGVIDPRLGPGMAGQVFAVFAIQVTRRITRRNPQAGRTGQKRVRVVLTDTGATGERLNRLSDEEFADDETGEVIRRQR